jgi:hypothetical protein
MGSVAPLPRAAMTVTGTIAGVGGVVKHAAQGLGAPPESAFSAQSSAQNGTDLVGLRDSSVLLLVFVGGRRGSQDPRGASRAAQRIALPSSTGYRGNDRCRGRRPRRRGALYLIRVWRRWYHRPRSSRQMVPPARRLECRRVLREFMSSRSRGEIDKRHRLNCPGMCSKLWAAPTRMALRVELPKSGRRYFGMSGYPMEERCGRMVATLTRAPIALRERRPTRCVPPLGFGICGLRSHESRVISRLQYIRTTRSQEERTSRLRVPGMSQSALGISGSRVSRGHEEARFGTGPAIYERRYAFHDFWITGCLVVGASGCRAFFPALDARDRLHSFSGSACFRANTRLRDIPCYGLPGFGTSCTEMPRAGCRGFPISRMMAVPMVETMP